MVLDRHPSYAALNRFADGELKSRRHRRVADHLAGCSRCRQEVAFIRRAGDLARSLDPPATPEGLLDDVLARRAAGERVLLPLQSPGADTPPRLRVFPAAAAALVLVTATLFLFTSLLEADRGGLDLEPERPRAGATLSATYDAGVSFPDETYLKLRARLRTESGRQWQQIAAILTREDDGLFRGEVGLPDSVVYAAFAVEDLHGRVVDSRNQTLWNVMVHGPDGRPTLAALGERFNDLAARGWMEARDVARTMTRLYPGSPRGWATLRVVEDYRGSVEEPTPLHLERFGELERTMSDSPPSRASDLSYLAVYAFTLGEWTSGTFWLRQAEERGDRSAAFYQTKIIQIRLHHRPDSPKGLREVESLWDEAPFPTSNIVDTGWRHALQIGDWDAALRWLERKPLPRGEAVHAAGLLRDLEDTFGAARVLEWALSHLDAEVLRGQGARPLHVDQATHTRSMQTLRQSTLAVIARLALVADRPSVAAGLASEAVPLAWSTPDLEILGDVLLEAGDTAAATTAFARAAADPVSEPPPSAITQRPGWTAAVERARTDLAVYILQEAVTRYLPRGFGPPTAAEAEVPALPETGRPGVVAFLASCQDPIEALNELAATLGAGAVTVVAATKSDLTPALLRECGLKIPVYRDERGRMKEAFAIIGFPDLFVLDAEGRIRFAHTSSDRIPRQLHALDHTGANRAIVD